LISVSIIIVNYNLTEEIRKLLFSIKNFIKSIDYEVIVVDNNSTDRSVENLSAEFPEFKFRLLSTNLGFGHANNVGAKIAIGKYLLLLNPDTYLLEDTPAKLFQFAENHPQFAVIGPRLIFPDRKFQVSYAKYPNIKQEIMYAVGLIGFSLTMMYKIKDFLCNGKQFYEVDFVFGSCMFIRKVVYELVKGFDETYFLFTEETDLCYRIKNYQGFRVIYWKGTGIIHSKSLVTGKNIPERIKLSYESKLIFFKKHYSALRLLLLRYTIVLVFLFKHLTLFRKGNAKQKYKKAYRSIIKLYLQQ
jgi:GT2 family glycosyltransferase